MLDAEKIKRPRIPQRTVEYLTKEELNRLRDAIPAHTWNGLRDRVLIEVLFSSGMRISEVLALDRAVLEWELRQAVIIGKGRKERKVYFSEEAIDWLTKYLSTRHDDYPAVFDDRLSAEKTPSSWDLGPGLSPCRATSGKHDRQYREEQNLHCYPAPR